MTMPSSVIITSYYDKAAATLRIVFVSGKVYEYINVPEKVYNALKASKSKGTYFNNFIKDKYLFKNITDEKYRHT